MVIAQIFFRSQEVRGVRQDDPGHHTFLLFVFIICAELLADAMKQNSQINGITVNNEEFLLGQ